MQINTTRWVRLCNEIEDLRSHARGILLRDISRSRRPWSAPST